MNGLVNLLLSAFILQIHWTSSYKLKLKDYFSTEPGNSKMLEDVATSLEELSKLVDQEFLGVSSRKGDLPPQAIPVDGGNRLISISQNQPGTPLPLLKFLYEGDILLTPKQAKHILEGFKKTIKSSSLSRVKRKFHRISKDWVEFPIKYTISSSLKSDLKATENIHEAIREWEKHTCITFKYVTEPSNEEDHLVFFRGGGCFSTIGRIGGAQQISIGYGCEKVGIVAHEIGHALGLWHEQSRIYRDDFIKVIFDNIWHGLAYNFIKLRYDQMWSFGVPYDYGSIMHYGSQAFTKDWSKNTIRTHYPGYQKTIGQREKLSFYDIKIINKAYCDGKCKSFKHPCEHGGYVDPKTCDRCVCPDGFSGDCCQRAEYSKNANCGGTVHLNGSHAYISSPGYPDFFQLDQKCSWLIKPPEGKMAFLEFIDQFHFYCPSTCVDYVEVKNSTDLANTGMRFCYDQKPAKRIYAATNEMMVIFSSKLVKDIGFKARINYCKKFF